MHNNFDTIVILFKCKFVLFFYAFHFIENVWLGYNSKTMNLIRILELTFLI